MFKHFVTSAFVLGTLAAVTPLYAQPGCASRDMLVEKLQDSYSEAYQGGGLQSSTSLIEIWSSPKTGSWTMLMTRADGVSCIVATGHNWQFAPDLEKLGIDS